MNNALYIYALEERAQEQGLYKGQPLANARAIVQPLSIVPTDEKADAALLESIADWCDRFTPLVGLDMPDGLLLDITGVAHLFGGEKTMLAIIIDQIRKQGFAVQGAIAGTSLAARALARYMPDRIVPLGGEAQAVATLPIIALDCDTKTLRALQHAGLMTVGMVASRLHSELSERLGTRFVSRLKVMLGAEEKPLNPHRTLPDFMAEQRFAEPIFVQEVITDCLLNLARHLSVILEREGRGVRILEAVFFRADGKVLRVDVRVGESSRDPEILLQLLQPRLDALADPLDLDFGIDLIRLQALLTEEEKPTTTSFDSNENAHRQVAFLVDRLSARFGEHRVQCFMPQQTHIPEAQAIAVPAQDRVGRQSWVLKRGPMDPPRRPLRLLEKPEIICVPLSEVPDGPPVRFRWRRTEFQVTHAEGPERIAMEWWEKEEGLSRDYFRVETKDGQRFWLYRDGFYKSDGSTPRWYLQGLFA